MLQIRAASGQKSVAAGKRDALPSKYGRTCGCQCIVIIYWEVSCMFTTVPREIAQVLSIAARKVQFDIEIPILRVDPTLNGAHVALHMHPTLPPA